MKIGLITYHKTTNYGACLQCMALERILNSMNCQCEIIDYSSKEILKRELPNFVFQKNIRRTIISFLTYLRKKRKYKYINVFLRTNCNFSIKQYDNLNIKDCADIYQKYIVGSDIVWEMNVNGGDFNYMLEFTQSNNKYAYSSSFGYSSIPLQYREKSIEQLVKFKKISVRENEGHNLLNNDLGINSIVTLDPTLLLDRYEWEKYEEKYPQKKKYILLYFADKDNRCFDFAKKISDENGYEILYLNDDLKTLKGVKTIKYVSVGQFISLIKEAECVITGSYHGVLFSINFNVPFYYYNRAHQSRIQTIVDNLHIKNKDLKSNVDNKFDWNSINEKLGVLRNDSIEYIRGIIND